LIEWSLKFPSREKSSGVHLKLDLKLRVTNIINHLLKSNIDIQLQVRVLLMRLINSIFINRIGKNLLEPVNLTFRK
jgi:hypothetical protein